MPASGRQDPHRARLPRAAGARLSQPAHAAGHHLHEKPTSPTACSHRRRSSAATPPLVSEAERRCWPWCRATTAAACARPCRRLTNRFERKPYGWYLAAIQCTLAKLCARGKIEVRQDANILEGGELGRALRNTQGFANVILAPQIDFTAAQVRQLKEFYAEFFDGPAAGQRGEGAGPGDGRGLPEAAGRSDATAASGGPYPSWPRSTAPMAVAEEHDRQAVHLLSHRAAASSRMTCSTRKSA